MHTIGRRLVGRSHLLPVALLLLLACTPSYSSPLHDAAVNGDIVLLKQLLDSGKHDVNGLDADGRTPLATALATCSALLYCSAALTQTRMQQSKAASVVLVCGSSLPVLSSFRQTLLDDSKCSRYSCSAWRTAMQTATCSADTFTQ
jgi:hypothetical protein